MGGLGTYVTCQISESLFLFKTDDELWTDALRAHGCLDPVERLGDGRCRRCCLLPRLKRHDIHHERRGREPVYASTRPDDPPQRPWHQESLGDPLRPREHQPLHAGETRPGVSVLTT